MIATVQQTLGTVPLGNAEGAPGRVVVKFYFTNPKHIPEGIPEKDRPSDAAMDELHATRAIVQQMAERAQVGRIRPGRVDTGDHVVDNLPHTQVAVLRRGLTNAHYLLADAHWFEAPAKDAGKKPKFVVCLTFVWVGENCVDMPALGRRTLEAIRELGRTTWSFCHVWNNWDEKNPDGVATVNLVGRLWDDKSQSYLPPRHAIVVSKGRLVAVPVKAMVSEDAEATVSAQQ